jgi:isopenicillin-N epimerase
MLPRVTAFAPRPDLWTLDPAVLHLNHGSYGAVPRRAQQAAAALREQTEANPMEWFRRLPERLDRTRATLAGHLGVDTGGFALVANASAGVTAALAAVPIPAGGTIVVTDHAYGAVRYACERFARLRGAEVLTAAVPLTATDDEVVAAIERVLDGRTAVVVVDQITSATAMVFPAARVAALCRQAGVPVIVDGAHAPGLIDAPVDGGADFWTGNFHKWPCAPRGTAGLYVAEPWRTTTLPLVASWSEYDELPRRFDQQATNDYVPWLAAPDALDVLGELDWPRRRAELSAMLDEAAAVVAKALGSRVPDVVAPAPTMRLVELPLTISTAEPALEEFKARSAREIRAEITVTGLGEQVYLRLSAHAYNAFSDYERLAERLPALLTP